MKRVNPFQNKPWFFRVCSKSLLKTLWEEKEKLLVTSNFSFSHSVFYPIGELSAVFTKFKIVVCKLFRIGRVLNLSFGKGLNCYEITLCNMNRKYSYTIPYRSTIQQYCLCWYWGPSMSLPTRYTVYPWFYAENQINCCTFSV